MKEQNYTVFFYGFYLDISRWETFIGFALSCAYIPEYKVFQIMLHIGTIAVAFGYDFN